MTASESNSICPGCGLEMPLSNSAYEGYYHCSPECWGVYSEVLGFEYSTPAVFGKVHQLTVDSYALQHAGGNHPDKSIAIHLAGLHAAFVLGIEPPRIPRLLKKLADEIADWPHFPPPKSTGPLRVFDVAMAEDALEHIALVQKWASYIWEAWSDFHKDIGTLVATQIAWT